LTPVGVRDHETFGSAVDDPLDSIERIDDEVHPVDDFFCRGELEAQG
jgi:hypothetical protein